MAICHVVLRAQAQLRKLEAATTKTTSLQLHVGTNTTRLRQSHSCAIDTTTITCSCPI
jgi:hypothetical protein